MTAPAPAAPDRCETCRFWSTGTHPAADCRRHGPVWIDDRTRWPVSYADHWCGEFEPKLSADALQILDVLARHGIAIRASATLDDVLRIVDIHMSARDPGHE